MPDWCARRTRLELPLPGRPAGAGPGVARTISRVEIRITVSIEPSARHARQPLTRAQVEHVVALRARIEAAVQEALEAQR